MKKLICSAVLIALLLPLAGACAAKSVKLEYKYTKGQVDKYKAVIKLRLQLPEMPKDFPLKSASIEMAFRQKVLNVYPDGSAKIDLHYSIRNISIPGFDKQKIPDMKNIPNVSMVVTMDKSGRVIGMDEASLGGKEAGFDFSKLIRQTGQYGSLPEEPVEVGETWYQIVPMGFGDKNLNVTGTLLAGAIPVGKRTAAKFKQTFEAHFELAEMMDILMQSISQGMQMNLQPQAQNELSKVMSQMKGGFDLTGWMVTYLDNADGKILKGSGNMKARMVLQFSPEMAQYQPGMPQQLNITADMDVSLVRESS